jgi:hypothetical protein
MRAVIPMRASARLIVLLALWPATVAAQPSSTLDGVHALLGGDYQRAIAILEPLAETTSTPDPVAQFFLAALFQSGGSARYNLSRACGLYLSAASAPGPLAPIAREIADVIEAQIGPRARATACAPASTHPWSELPPASLTLGPGYSIEISATSYTVVLNGERYRKPALNAGPGTLFLPVRYTPLQVPMPSSPRRHFIHVFVWHRNDPSDVATWSLGWLLNEVVGTDVVMVTGDPRLITVATAQPPPVDLAQLVPLRVNEIGEVEWRIADAASPRSGVIK